MGYRINYCMPSSFLVVYKYLSSTKYYYVDNGKYDYSSRNNTKYQYDCKSYAAFQNLLNMKASQVKSEADLKTSIFDSEKLCDAFPQLVKAAHNRLKRIITDPSLIKSYGYTYTIQVEKKSKEVWAWNYTIPKKNNRWLEDEFKKSLGSKSMSRTLNIHKFDDKTLKKLRDFDNAFGESIVGYSSIGEQVTDKDQLINALFINIVELYFTYLIETTNTTLLTTQGSKYSVSEYVAEVIPDNASFCCEPFGRTGAITIFAKKFDGGILSEPQPAWYAMNKSIKLYPYEFFYWAMTYAPTRVLHDYIQKKTHTKSFSPTNDIQPKKTELKRSVQLFFMSRSSIQGRDRDSYVEKQASTLINSMLRIFYINKRLADVSLYNSYAQNKELQNKIQAEVINSNKKWLCFIDSPYIGTQPYSSVKYLEPLPSEPAYDIAIHKEIIDAYIKHFDKHYVLLSHSDNTAVNLCNANAGLVLIGRIKERMKTNINGTNSNIKAIYKYTNYYANQNLVDWLNKNKPRENNLKWGDINNIPELKDIPEVNKTTEAQASKTKSPTKNN